MKPLDTLNNVEKGKLLADLFPGELQGILEAIKGMHTVLQEQEDDIRQQWDNGLITADFWYRIAGEVNGAVERYGTKLCKSSRMFADHLFDGYRALYTVDCIAKHAEKTGGRFLNAVKMLFHFG